MAASILSNQDHENLYVSSTKQFVVGVDVGGTKIAIALVDEEGRIHISRKYPTEVATGYQAILKGIAEVIEEMNQMTNNSIVAVGFGVSGQINPDDGSVIFSPNLRWQNVPVQEDMSALTHLPVVVMNDVRAATVGEWVYGAGKGCDDIVCVFVGTGIGGGVISQGKISQGFSNAAGEIGHTIILMNGDRCNCGSRGCLETLAAGWAIAKKAKAEIKKNQLCGRAVLEKADGNIEKISTKLIVEAFHENDPLAIELIEQMGDALTVAGINIANSFNPQRIILGGGAIRNLPNMCSIVETGIRKNCLQATSEPLTVLRAQLDDKAGIIGASLFAWEKYHSLRRM